MISYSRNRSLLKRIVLMLGNILLKPFSAQRLSEKVVNCVNSFSTKEKNNIGCYLCPYGIKTVVKSSVFGSSHRMNFENQEIEVPLMYDVILTQLYGNYMIPPKTENRVSTHTSSIYLVSNTDS